MRHTLPHISQEEKRVPPAAFPLSAFFFGIHHPLDPAVRCIGFRRDGDDSWWGYGTTLYHSILWHLLRREKWILGVGPGNLYVLGTGHLLWFRMNYVQIHKFQVCFYLNLLIQTKSQFTQQFDGREVVGVHYRYDLRLAEYQVSMLQYGIGRFARVALVAIFGQEGKSEIGLRQGIPLQQTADSDRYIAVFCVAGF